MNFLRKNKLFVVGAFGVILTTIFLGVFQNSKQKEDTPSIQNNNHSKADGYFEYLNSLRANQQTGRYTLQNIEDAKAEVLANRALSFKKSLPLTWKSMGPDNVGGRTRGFLVDRNDHKTLYAAGVSGGVFKSENKGGTWYPLTTQLDNMFVASMAQTIDGSIYAGTGESAVSNNAIGDESSSIKGGGILKSTDGETFSLLSNTLNTSFTEVSVLVAHPSKNVIYAGTGTGLWNSVDGGENWTRIRLGNCRDMKISKSGTMLAYVGGQVYRSTNPDDANAYQPVSGIPGGVRIALAISDANEEYMYAMVAGSVAYAYNGTTVNPSSGLVGLYQSKDNGLTFSRVAGPANQYFNPLSRVDGSSQGWYDLTVAVHPENPERVFMGGIGFAEWDPTQGARLVGNTFDSPNNRFGIHADKHNIVFDTISKPLIMYISSDGGVAKTTNTSLTNYAAINNGYSTTQFYNVAGSSDGKTIIGGTQDNNTILVQEIERTTKNSGFEILSGDGFHCDISSYNEDVMFYESQFGNLVRSLNGGEGSSKIFDSRIEQSLGSGSPTNLFNTPFRLWESPTDEDTSLLFYAANREIWVAVNPTLPNTPSWYKLGSVSFTPSIISPSVDGSKLFVGGRGGLVRFDGLDKIDFAVPRIGLKDSVVDALYEFTDSVVKADISAVSIRTGLPGNRSLTSIAVDRNDANHVVVTYGNYGNNAYVYRTKDVNSVAPTWSNITGNLPKMPIYHAIINFSNPNEIVLGTEFGIWATENGNSNAPTWTEQNNGIDSKKPIPYVPVFEIRQLGRKDQTWKGPILLAGSHGRGLFKSESLLTTIKENKKVNKLTIYPNPAKVYVNLPSVEPKSKYQIFDLGGKAILSGNVNQNKKINVNPLTKGLYILVVTQEDGTLFSEKLIKE